MIRQEPITPTKAQPNFSSKAKPNTPPLAGEVKLSLTQILELDPCNCRPELGDAPIDELAADIREHGQLQAVIVRPHGAGYRVLAGGRRWRAMNLNHAGNLALGEIRARVFDGDDEHARELSLAENIARESLHPLDEAEAFARVAAEIGVDVAARRFGKRSLWGLQRVALAALSPRVKYAWRDEEFGLESARALASTRNHDAQDALLDAADADAILRAPLEIRRRLSSRVIKSGSALARFVGVADYVAAGGLVELDFWDEESVLEDVPLLERLAVEKSVAIASALLVKEGWGFVVQPGPKWRVAVEPDYLAAEGERLTVLELALSGELSPDREIELVDEADRIRGAAHCRAVSKSERARYGVRVTFDSEGRPDIERALQLVAAESLTPRAPMAGDEPPPPEPGSRAAEGDFSPPGKGPRKTPKDAPLTYPARRAMYAAPTLAIAPHVATNDELAMRLAIVVLARAGHHLRPIRIERAQSSYGATSELLLAIAANIDFADGLALAMAASIEDVRRAFREIVASAVDLRGCYDHDVEPLLEALAPFAPKLRDEIVAAFEYAAFFREAGRATALRAIRDVGGEALERSHAWRKDAELIAEAAVLAKGASWLPEELQ